MSARPAALHPLLRPLGWGDLDRIMEIELAAYPSPWTRGIFSDCLRVGYDCWGLQVGGELAGYSVQNDLSGECHLLNLCVGNDWRHRGYGGLILDNAIRIARAQGCASMYLEVRPSNRVAIALYEKRRFEVVGRRRGYYSKTVESGGGDGSGSPREDALVMRLGLGSG